MLWIQKHYFQSRVTPPPPHLACLGLLPTAFSQQWQQQQQCRHASNTHTHRVSQSAIRPPPPSRSAGRANPLWGFQAAGESGQLVTMIHNKSMVRRRHTHPTLPPLARAIRLHRLALLLSLHQPTPRALCLAISTRVTRNMFPYRVTKHPET